MIKITLSIFFIFSCLSAKTVNIISHFCPKEQGGGCDKIYQKYEVTCSCPLHSNLQTLTLDFDAFDVFVFFDLNVNFQLSEDQKRKCILINMEPFVYSQQSLNNFSKVFTWNDDLVDDAKFVKLHYPNLKQMLSNVPEFNNKKFLCMIASNWVPHRIDCLEYFQNKPAAIDIYGKFLPLKYVRSPFYRGSIPGTHGSDQKFETLKNYKYNLCFENTVSAKGYITEKIFHSFAAGCVPVYWGATNIANYIPENCYIDFRKFKNYDELIDYLNSISEDEYNAYLGNIRCFLNSQNAKKYEYDAFIDTVGDLIESID